MLPERNNIRNSLRFWFYDKCRADSNGGWWGSASSNINLKQDFNGVIGHVLTQRAGEWTH